MSVIDDIFEAANELIGECFNEIVNLTRGTATTTGIEASWERHVSRVDALEEVPTTAVVMRRWWVAIEDYKFSGAAATPQRGDRITQADSTIWEVAAEDKFPSHEKNQDFWMVRAKQVS